jgi:SAM-dependent methyltransferase
VSVGADRQVQSRSQDRCVA